MALGPIVVVDAEHAAARDPVTEVPGSAARLMTEEPTAS
jgi:hypothetical protein